MEVRHRHRVHLLLVRYGAACRGLGFVGCQGFARGIEIATRKAKGENGEPAEPPEIPDGTVGQHAKGKFACEVCGAEFDDEGGVTSHYIEQHAKAKK